MTGRVSPETGPGTPESRVADTSQVSEGSDQPPSTSVNTVPRRGPGSSGRRWVLSVVVSVVVLVVVVLVLWAFAIGNHPGPTTNTTILVPNGSLDIIPPQQFDSVNFENTGSSTVGGTFTTSFGVTVYRMTPGEFQTFVKTGVPSTWEWTSGFVPLDTSYQLDITVPSGSWVLAFYNPSPLNTTGVGFNTDLTETS